MDDKNTAFLAALAGLADPPTPSTRDEAMLKAIVDRLAAIEAAVAAAAEPELPDIPEQDGDYELLMSVTSGEPVLTWESTT